MKIATARVGDGHLSTEAARVERVEVAQRAHLTVRDVRKRHVRGLVVRDIGLFVAVVSTNPDDGDELVGVHVEPLLICTREGDVILDKRGGLAADI